MNPEQIVTRLFNSIRKDVIRFDPTKQLEVYQVLIDELEREMGRIEEDNSGDDVDYDDPSPSDSNDEGDQ